VASEPQDLREHGGGRVGPPAAAVVESPSLWQRVTVTQSFESMSALGLAVALGLLVIVIVTQTPYFLTTGNLVNTGRAIVSTGVVAAAMTLVLVCRELDLSVGALIALGGVASAEMLGAGYSGGAAILVGLAVGLGAGAVNAFLIVGLNVNALICTIGTQFAFRGLAYIWTSGSSLNAYGFSGFSYLGQGRWGNVYFSTILMLIVFVVLGFVLSQTKYGSHIYAIGGSRVAARRVGIKEKRVRASVYLLSGLSAALAGVIITSANGSASPQSGLGDELLIISAVIIGGTSLLGGRGNLFGTFLGVLFLGVLQNGMDLVGLQSFWQIFIEGVVLVIAVTIDEQFRRRKEREE
jgi:ribose/xylose/arabinose/galactoside ABC-type transport system permease subunit